MGNKPSTEETAKKLARERPLTLPVGSKVEQLFYEDFDPDAQQQESSNPTASSSKSKKQKRHSSSSHQPSPSQSYDQWAPIPGAQTGFSDSEHLSKHQRPLHNISDKPLPSAPPIGPGLDFFLSPSDAHSRSSSKGKEKESSTAEKHDSGTATFGETTGLVEAKPEVSMETTPSSSTYSAAESRWQKRVSRRIADTKASDGVKAGLSQTAYMGTDLGQKEEQAG